LWLLMFIALFCDHLSILCYIPNQSPLLILKIVPGPIILAAGAQNRAAGAGPQPTLIPDCM
jgi:hypothetical protein